jgi:hypothetical protein
MLVLTVEGARIANNRSAYGLLSTFKRREINRCRIPIAYLTQEQYPPIGRSEDRYTEEENALAFPMFLGLRASKSQGKLRG